MKTLNKINLKDIGEFRVYSIKPKVIGFEKVTIEGKPIVEKVVISAPIKGQYIYKDADGNELSEVEVCHNVAGNIMREVKRTKNISKYKEVERFEVDDLVEKNVAILDCDESTKAKFRELTAETKAIKFNYKKSTRGFKFSKGFIYEENGTFIMADGSGSISEGIAELQKNIAEGDSTIVQENSITADNIEMEI